MKNISLILVLISFLVSCSSLNNDGGLPFEVSTKLSIQQVKNLRWKIRKHLTDVELETFFEGQIEHNEMIQTPNKDPYFGERNISPNCLKPNRPKSEIISIEDSKILMMHSTATAEFISGVCSNVYDRYRVQQLVLSCKEEMFEVKIYYPIRDEWKTEPAISCK